MLPTCWSLSIGMQSLCSDQGMVSECRWQEVPTDTWRVTLQRGSRGLGRNGRTVGSKAEHPGLHSGHRQRDLWNCQAFSWGSCLSWDWAFSRCLFHSVSSGWIFWGFSVSPPESVNSSACQVSLPSRQPLTPQPQIIFTAQHPILSLADFLLTPSCNFKAFAHSFSILSFTRSNFHPSFTLPIKIYLLCENCLTFPSDSSFSSLQSYGS